jgi:F-type H+-transporting ATPase subunit delta
MRPTTAGLAPNSNALDERTRAFDVATDEPIMASVPGRYASALFELAKEQGQLPAIEQDLVNFQALLDQSEDLTRMVRSPVIDADEQRRALAAVVERAGIGGLVANFFQLIAKNRRLFAVADMIRAFRALAARERGEVTAEVASAHPLSEAHVAELKATLRASVGKDVQLNARVDPSLLGGLIVKIGSRMIDNSLRTKLLGLKVAMKGGA